MDATWIAALGYEGDEVVAYIGSPSLPEAVDVERGGQWDIWPLETLLTIMERDRIAQLWLHDSFLQAQRIPAEVWLKGAKDAGWKAYAERWDHEKVLGWIDFWHGGVCRSVFMPRLDTRVPWREAPDARSLLDAVLLYNAAIGQSYCKSPGKTSNLLIHQLHHAHPEMIGEGNPPVPAPAREANTERRFNWCRALTEDELRADWLVSYDKNAAYLGASSSIMCGVGEPEHFQAESAYDEVWISDFAKCCGYYRASFVPSNHRLPDPFLGDRSTEDGTVWVTAPTMALADELHALPHVYEAYVWRESHRTLEPWYKRLRDARAELKREGPGGDMRRIALSAVKDTYTQGIGWFNGSWMRDGATASTDLYRPHWRHAVIAQTRANLYRMLLKLDAAGVRPFAINEDCLYFLASEDELGTIAHTLPRNDTLAGFKRVDFVSTDEIRAELDALHVATPEARPRMFGKLKAQLAQLEV